MRRRIKKGKRRANALPENNKVRSKTGNGEFSST
jgi:hypothetical protein